MPQVKEREKLDWKAIFFGFFVVANLGSAALQLLIKQIAETLLAAQGHSPGQMASALADSLGYQFFLLGWDLAFTGMGGYLAARLAGREEMRHARRVGVLTAGGGVVFLLLLLPSSLWLHSLSVIGAVPAALAGGYTRIREHSAAR